MKELFHVDPITIVVLIVGFVGTWTALKKDSRWHTTWIKAHDKDCKETRAANSEILTELRTSNAHLTTLMTAIQQRQERTDDEIVRVRDRSHDLANELQKAIYRK